MKFLIALLITYVNCWWEVGHMMTAQVAKQQLKTKRPDVLEWAESLIKDFNNLTDGRSNTFAEAAVWADDIKEPGTSYLFNWHFTDRPINPDGLLIQMDSDQLITNSVVGMDRAKNTLTNKQTAKYRHTVFKAQMIRMLLHLVGDIHQPLHNANFYNASYVSGDMGGNLLKIQLQNGTFVNFHSFWDSGAFAFQPNNSFLVRPLNAKDQAYMENWATSLMNTYPLINYAALDMTNPDVWTYVGFRQATQFAYPMIQTNNSFNDDYVKQAQQFCEENLAVGGYRLAAKLVEIYDIILQNEKGLTDIASIEEQN